MQGELSYHVKHNKLMLYVFSNIKFDWRCIFDEGRGGKYHLWGLKNTVWGNISKFKVMLITLSHGHTTANTTYLCEADHI